MKGKYYYIGLNLKIPHYELDDIKKGNDNSLDCLRLVLKEFLQHTKPKPTWSAIVESLKSRLVDMPMLAERIKKKYCLPSQDTMKCMMAQ